jgi:hypothetical protein
VATGNQCLGALQSEAGLNPASMVMVLWVGHDIATTFITRHLPSPININTCKNPPNAQASHTTLLNTPYYYNKHLLV